ncbi:MAG: hypothetical protein ABJA37_06135 [Ferruginibacter sp.]
MSNNLKNILSNLNKDTEQDKLLEYLNNQLPQAEQHAVEARMNDDEFMSDAMDGLQQLENKKDVSSIVNQLNTGLKKQLDKKKKRKTKRVIAEQSWVYYAIILLLILIIVTYIIIKKITT